MNENFGNVMFNERYLVTPPSGKQGLNANEANFAADCVSMIAGSDLIMGAWCWTNELNPNIVFQGYLANYVYSPNKLAGYIVGSNGNLKPTDLATNRLNANRILAKSYGVNVLPTGYAGNQLPFAWVKPGTTGLALKIGMPLYIKVPINGMSDADKTTVYAFPLGTPSSNTYIYTGYTLAQLLSNVVDEDLGILLQVKANASNLANLADNNA